MNICEYFALSIEESLNLILLNNNTFPTPNICRSSTFFGDKVCYIQNPELTVKVDSLPLSYSLRSEVFNFFHIQDIWWLISITLIFFRNKNLLVTRLSDAYLACSGIQGLKLMCGENEKFEIFASHFRWSIDVHFIRWGEMVRWTKLIAINLCFCPCVWLVLFLGAILSINYLDDFGVEMNENLVVISW